MSRIDFPRDQRGVSLIELMIGIALSLLLLASVLYVFLSSRQGYDSQERLARLQESSRFAMEAVVEDLRRAGYLGGNADVETITGADDPDNEPSCTDEAWGKRIGRRIFAINDSAAGYDCIDNHLRGDVLVIRYAEAPIVETPADGRLYLRTSLFEGQLTVPPETNTVVDEPQWVRAMTARAYYVANSGRQCEGEDIPSLWVVAMDADGSPDGPQELVPGVEQFQVLLGVDTDGDRSVDDYVSAGAVADWDQVIAARVWVLARSECPEGGHSDSFSYAMGDLSPAYTPADNFRRQLSVATVQLRNRPSGEDAFGGGGDDDGEDDGEVTDPPPDGEAS
ncbi:PilW family protein [Pseudazoarcus pumilus]|uniref:Pilus assembly protein PilW n=1 Tax=Pseudazoarcus pumilus TaxID=2067960 RepID=A0A2I6S8A4_9RHOO|nr:PilW family protein [Pseudazoarcus pumilus]AUN95494.1 hypothetical protein C0099_11490 [Pseudazoarcus pumilus]